MEVHRQTCQACGCRQMRNLLYRETGQKDKVFVQCTSCDALVARYVLAQRGYYHHGRGFESYLRSLNRGGHFESAKELKNDFEEVSENSQEEFQRVMDLLEKEGKRPDS